MLLDAYACQSRWRSVPPPEKLMIAGTGLGISLISHHMIVVWSLFPLMLLVNIFLHGHPLKLYPRLLLIPMMFVVPSTVMVMLSLGEPNALSDIIFSLRLSDGWALSVTRSGISQALLLLGKSLSAYASLLLLVLSTPVLELTSFLERCHVPCLFAELMLLTYRMIGVLVETQENIYRAQVSRCGWGDYSGVMRSASLLIFNLFSRSLFYTRRMGLALEARGYQGSLRVIQPATREPSSHRFFVMAASALLLLSAAWLEWGHDH